MIQPRDARGREALRVKRSEIVPRQSGSMDDDAGRDTGVGVNYFITKERARRRRINVDLRATRESVWCWTSPSGETILAPERMEEDPLGLTIIDERARRRDFPRIAGRSAGGRFIAPRNVNS